MATRSSTLANTDNARCSQGSVSAPNQESLVKLTSRSGWRLPDAAQKSLQNIFVANHRTEFPGLSAGFPQSHHRGSLAGGESARARRQKIPQPRKGIDARNVFAECQQAHLVVASHRPSVAIEQNGRIECIVVRRIVHVRADHNRHGEAAANHSQGFGREVGAEIPRQGHGIAAFAPHQELRAGLLQPARLRLQGR